MDPLRYQAGSAKTFASKDLLNTDLCPYGCCQENGQSDGRRFCRHFIGITLQGNLTRFHVRKLRTLPDKDGRLQPSIYDFIDGDDCQAVLSTDTVIPLTASGRVYRDDPPDGKRVIPFDRDPEPEGMRRLEVKLLEDGTIIVPAELRALLDKQSGKKAKKGEKEELVEA